MERLGGSLRLYLETSVWSYVTAFRFPERQRATLRLLEQAAEDKVEIFISDLVAAEILDTPNRKKLDQFLKTLERHKPVTLDATEESDLLAEEYIQRGIVPREARDDAAHVAIATVHGLDAVVSWNLRHIVRLETRRGINGCNRMLGYREIDLCTPEEVIRYDA